MRVKRQKNWLNPKQYLSKIWESYKNRWYEKIFLEHDFNFLWDIKETIRQICVQNDMLTKIIEEMYRSKNSILKNKNMDFETKELVLAESEKLYSMFLEFNELLTENEIHIIENIDRYREIEKEIDIKTKTLTKYWFDQEFEYIMENLQEKKHKEISVIIFDQNNLKTINETYGHQIWQESIWRYWSMLDDELKKSWLNYILSNYYWWDEWFLVIEDISKLETVKFIKNFFSILESWPLRIREFDIKLSSCAWICHFHPWKNNVTSFINTKTLLHIADTLLLQSKIQKNRNKSWNSYKSLNATNLTEEDLAKMSSNIQTMPKKLNKNSLDKKMLLELFEIRKAQNEKIMKARTLWVKKILRHNIDIINEIIWLKIIEWVSKVLAETRFKAIEWLPMAISWAFDMLLEKIPLSKVEKDSLKRDILESEGFMNLTRKTTDYIFSENIFEIEKNIPIKKKKA